MITNSSSSAEEANVPGADCNAHLGFFLRECYTCFEFMPFEASGKGSGSWSWGKGAATAGPGDAATRLQAGPAVQLGKGQKG